MSRAPASKTPRDVALSGALLVASLSFPGAAMAAPFTCEASALRGSVASAPSDPKLYRTFTLPRFVDIG